jgi:hypothetical protein
VAPAEALGRPGQGIARACGRLAKVRNFFDFCLVKILHRLVANRPWHGLYQSASVKVSGSEYRFTMTRKMCHKEYDVAWEDLFDLGAMAGGWDEAAWAARGLPVEGDLKLTLKVSLG